MLTGPEEHKGVFPVPLTVAFWRCKNLKHDLLSVRLSTEEIAGLVRRDFVVVVNPDVKYLM